MATLNSAEKKVLDRLGGMMLVTNMTAGTSDALGNDPALTALANFVNGVRIALIDPDIARRLSDAAEYMVTQEEVGSSDDVFLPPVEAARAAFGRLDRSLA